MNKLVVGIIAVVLVFVGIIAVSANNEPQETTTQTTFASVQSDVAGGAKFYDVRTPQEYAAGHFEGAENLSLQDMQAGSLPEVSKDTKIYVQCQSGNRSGQAAALLRQAGYTNVVDLGGLSDVQRIGGKLQ